MIELGIENYKKLSTLLGAVPFNTLFAKVVIEGKINGRVFADNESNPSVGLIVHSYGMALLFGNTQNSSFNDKLVSFLKNDSLNSTTAKWLLISPNDWKSKLSLLLNKSLIDANGLPEDEHLQKLKQSHILLSERVNFKFDMKSFRDNGNIPEGFELKRIDKEIYRKISGTVVPHFFWNNEDDFLKNAIGFSLLCDGEVVSSCFASFIVRNKLELGIETSLKFRKGGYAVYPARALISYCLLNGYESIWACRKENVGSFKLAEKLGFFPSTYHPYYILPIQTI